MIWLDSLLAVPVIGVHIVPNFSDIFEFQKRGGNFIDFLSKQEGFGIDKLEIKGEELWGYSISVEKTGFSFKVTPNNITGQFTYHISKIEKPGALPSYELPAILPYSQMLDRVLKYLENILDSIRDLREFKFERIGIVANVSSTRETLPPGVIRWIDHIAKPWGEISKSETLLLAKLSEDENYHDRCHHVLRFDETLPEDGIKLALDWQRVFKRPIGLTENKGLMTNVELCKTESLKYFQQFGEGDLNYG